MRKKKGGRTPIRPPQRVRKAGKGLPAKRRLPRTRPRSRPTPSKANKKRLKALQATKLAQFRARSKAAKKGWRTRKAKAYARKLEAEHARRKGLTRLIGEPSQTGKRVTGVREFVDPFKATQEDSRTHMGKAFDDTRAFLSRYADCEPRLWGAGMLFRLLVKDGGIEGDIFYLNFPQHWHRDFDLARMSAISLAGGMLTGRPEFNPFNLKSESGVRASKSLPVGVFASVYLTCGEHLVKEKKREARAEKVRDRRQTRHKG